MSDEETVRLQCDDGSVEVTADQLVELARFDLVESPFTVAEIRGALTGDLPTEFSADDD